MGLFDIWKKEAMERVGGEALKEQIRRALSQREKRVIRGEGLTPAAVLLLLQRKDKEYRVLFTQRTRKVEHHKGQISFPGGSYDRGDGDLLTTALRESFEEIGLQAKDIEILGELDDSITVSNFIVSPFVGAIPYPYQFKINEFEVERLIEVPLPALLDKSNFKEETRFPGEQPHPVYFYLYQGDVIWGATAKILKDFLDLVFR